MSTSSTIFSGNSRYSADFQQVIDRAVAIASLPITQLTTEKTELGGQSAALGSLDSRVSSLQNAVATLDAATGLGSYDSAISDGSVLSASLTDGVMAGTYSVQVVSTGSYATALSKDGLAKVKDPNATSLSTAQSFTLKVGTGDGITIKPAANTLLSLADAINNDPDAGVQATVVNLGGAFDPDYRLSLKSAKLGDLPIQLSAGTASLMDAQDPPGASAQYRVNGKPATAIESASRTVAIAPGLTVTLNQPGSTDISVTRSITSISNALASLAGAYNAAVDELDKHRGTAGGALAGQSIIGSVAEAMRRVTDYSGETGGITSLASLGLTFDEHGKLSFDSSALSTAASDNLAGVIGFLGSSGTGGFLKTAHDALASLEDDTSGAVKTTMASVQSQMAAQDRLIANNQERVDNMKRDLQRQIAATDALIASLEQQVNYIGGMFDSMRVAAESYK